MSWRAALLFLFAVPAGWAAPEDYFAIEVQDAATGRGVPLIELETVSHLRFCTDSQGLIALSEPELMGRKIYFSIHAPGYEVPADGFGMHGQVLEVKAGAQATIKLKRANIAERLYRITGAGIYRDSVLLGRPVPIEEPLLNGGVAGQDSTVAALFHHHLFWFNGDSLRQSYPLGQYWTSGAISDLPGAGGLDPEKGINRHYLVDDQGFVRPMWPKPEEGVIWTDGVLVLPAADGHEQMVAHYSHMKSLTETIAHGIGLFDDRKNEFAFYREFPKIHDWHCLNGQPLAGRGRDAGTFLFPAPDLGLNPFPAVRAKANLENLAQPDGYVGFTYLKPGSEDVERDATGRIVYDWKPASHPVSPQQERDLIAAGALSEAEALYQVHDLESGALLEFHEGSVRWNEYRRRWVMIAEQINGESSFTGEIWYAEAECPVGPWRHARRILTHDKQSFYNPVHHPFFDQDGGRLIYFEGTYTNVFGGQITPTPRYDYNQIMYRLDLSDARLRP